MKGEKIKWDLFYDNNFFDNILVELEEYSVVFFVVKALDVFDFGNSYLVLGSVVSTS